MRIAIICQGLPHPTRGASIVLYHHYIRAAVERATAVRLVVLDQSNTAPSAEAVEEAAARYGGGAEFELVRIGGFPQVRHGVVMGLRIDGAIEASVHEDIEKFKPDVVLCFDWIAAAMVARSHWPRVVWLGDLQFEALRWHTRLSLQEGSQRLDRLALLGLRIHQMKRFYRQILKDANIVVSSKSSEEHLGALGLEGRYFPYPWPELPGKVERPAPPKVPSFLFSGTLGALGSRSAFHTLFRDIYPRVSTAFSAGGFSIFMTGAGELPEWVAREIAARPEIRFLGFVDDLRATMDACTAFIAPIDVPVGNRSRILTCMSVELPVVAHVSTALGNPLLRDGETCLLAGNADDFVHAMRRVHEDQELASAIAQRAREAFLSNHAPDVASPMLVDHLSHVANSV